MRVDTPECSATMSRSAGTGRGGMPTFVYLERTLPVTPDTTDHLIHDAEVASGEVRRGASTRHFRRPCASIRSRSGGTSRVTGVDAKQQVVTETAIIHGFADVARSSKSFIQPRVAV